VITATRGEEGLGILETAGPFDVVLSDMRMPGMDGATFLTRVRQGFPDAVRMLLTGYSDLQAAVLAVNEGQVFRFLTKPCPPEQLIAAVRAAIEQHQLVTAERDLLERTLKGSIKALIDVLALASPRAFGRATRVRKHAVDLASALKLRDPWKVEVAAMLSELGSVVVPDEIAEKHYGGKDLTDGERIVVERAAATTDELLSSIPRLEPVRDILALARGAGGEAGGGQGGSEAPIEARVLRIAAGFEELETKGYSSELAIERMQREGSAYDQNLLFTFAGVRHRATVGQRSVALSPREIREGMIFAQDVRTATGALLVSRGYEVTRGFLERARNFRGGGVAEPLHVLLNNAQQAAVERKA